MISADFERYKNTDYFPSAPHNKNSVSSRGWRSAPRDLTPAQALARYDRRVLRFRRDRPLCDLIAAGRSLVRQLPDSGWQRKSIAPRCDQTIKQKQEHRTDNRADEAGGLTWFIPMHRLAQ